jgi:hypothetical protein
VFDTFSLSVPATVGSGNEDAIVTGDGVAVVVDGAGIPAELRAGCEHSVEWFAQSVAQVFYALLVARSLTMVDALAETITCVRDSHAGSCDLAAGSPSATVAAWRATGGRLEYLVLCDASLILVDRHDHGVELTDRRLQRVLDAAAAELGPATTGNQPADAVRAAQRQAVEATRNRPDGFWCVHHDPAAAQHAVHGEVAVEDYAGVVACSDGGARAYELLGTHTLDEFARQSLSGALQSVAESIRSAESAGAEHLLARALKVHDDLTIAASPLASSRSH